MEPTALEFAAYAGVYQAYAWQQGYEGKPVRFRLPDQYFDNCDDEVAEGFNLKKFMAVVADFDEGAIHYWKFEEEEEDRFITLVCTEDDSMRSLDEDDFHLASYYITT